MPPTGPGPSLHPITLAARLEGEELMGLERMVFGVRVAGLELGVAIDSFEYGLVERCEL